MCRTPTWPVNSTVCQNSKPSSFDSQKINASSRCCYRKRARLIDGKLLHFFVKNRINWIHIKQSRRANRMPPTLCVGKAEIGCMVPMFHPIPAVAWTSGCDYGASIKKYKDTWDRHAELQFHVRFTPIIGIEIGWVSWTGTQLQKGIDVILGGDSVVNTLYVVIHGGRILPLIDSWSLYSDARRTECRIRLAIKWWTVWSDHHFRELTFKSVICR